jgi:hypothetical protein
MDKNTLTAVAGDLLAIGQAVGRSDDAERYITRVLR